VGKSSEVIHGLGSFISFNDAFSALEKISNTRYDAIDEEKVLQSKPP
jgi:hypothetical protein